MVSKPSKSPVLWLSEIAAATSCDIMSYRTMTLLTLTGINTCNGITESYSKSGTIDISQFNTTGQFFFLFCQIVIILRAFFFIVLGPDFIRHSLIVFRV